MCTYTIHCIGGVKDTDYLHHYILQTMLVLYSYCMLVYVGVVAHTLHHC